MTDYVNDNLANPADPVDINVRPGGVAEASWWGASRQKFVLDAIASLRTYAKAIPATVTTAANAAAAASAAVTALVSALAAQVSTNLAEVLNNPSAGVSGSTSVRFRSNAGVLERSEAGGAYKPTWAHDNVSVSASGGAIALTVREHLNLELAADAAVTFGALTLAGGALSQNKGVHLTMHVTQDGTGYHKVTWPSWLKASFLQPRQGPGQESAFHFTSESDGTFRLVAFDAIDTRRPLHVRDYGADPTNTLDSAPAINACLFDSAATYHGKTILDHGIYRTDDTIHLGYGTSFNSVTLEGEGYAYNAQSGFRGSALKPTFSDRPCVNFQGARGSRLIGVALVGKLVSWIDSNGLAQGSSAAIDDTDPASWVDPSLAATQDSRYAPYAGVSVDAYSGSQPATHYPSVSYPAALGAVSQYNKNFSSDCRVVDCHITGFNVGLVNQPGDSDGNGDFTALVSCQINYCKYGVSVGNTQSRNVRVSDCKISLVHTMFVNGKHGRQDGKFGGIIDNCSAGAAIQVVDLTNTSKVGPLTFDNFYAEAMHRVGTVTTPTAVETSVHFRNCQVSFDLNSDARGYPATHLDGGGGAVDFRFDGCEFTSFYSVLMMAMDGVSMRGSSVSSVRRNGAPSIPTYEQLAHNLLLGGLGVSLLTPAFHERLHAPRYNLDTGVGTVGIRMQDQFQGAIRQFCTPLYTGSCMSPGSDEREGMLCPSYPTAHDKSSWSSKSIVGRTLTFTNGYHDWQSETTGSLAPGDVLVDEDTHTVFFIRSRTGTTTSTVIAEAQNNFKSDGLGGFALINPVSLTSGYMYALNSRLYTPNQPLLVDSTASSATLTNAGRDDSYFESSDIAVGDYIWSSGETDAWVTMQSSKIASIVNSGGTQTITMAGVAARTVSRKRLKWLIRQPPANV